MNSSLRLEDSRIKATILETNSLQRPNARLHQPTGSFSLEQLALVGCQLWFAAALLEVNSVFSRSSTAPDRISSLTILAQAVQDERDRLLRRFAQRLSTCAFGQFARRRVRNALVSTRITRKWSTKTVNHFEICLSPARRRFSAASRRLRGNQCGLWKPRPNSGSLRTRAGE